MSAYEDGYMAGYKDAADDLVLELEDEESHDEGHQDVKLEIEIEPAAAEQLADQIEDELESLDGEAAPEDDFEADETDDEETDDLPEFLSRRAAPLTEAPPEQKEKKHNRWTGGAAQFCRTHDVWVDSKQDTFDHADCEVIDSYRPAWWALIASEDPIEPGSQEDATLIAAMAHASEHGETANVTAIRDRLGFTDEDALEIIQEFYRDGE